MERWSDDAFRDEALSWARDRLAALGRGVVGAPEQFHVRPWSTVFRIPTASGHVYLKAVPAKFAHEVRLTRWLAERFPDRVLAVLAADDERGLMLLPEGGARLREIGADARAWERFLAAYAALQLGAAPHAADVLALGVPDRRLARLPAAFVELLGAAEVRLAGRYASLCAELADFGVPETVQMDDLHDGNVFVDASNVRVFDWGDASVAHPFFSLEMALATMAKRFGVGRDGAAVRRARDAYLEPFERIAPLSSLRKAAALAARVVPTVRCLSWRLAFGDVPPEERGRSEETLEELLEQQRAALAAGVSGRG